VFVLFPQGGPRRPEIYIMCVSVCRKSLPVRSVKMENTWHTGFSGLRVAEEKHSLEFLSDTPTSPSDFLWDMGRNLYRKSQKCPLCVLHILTGAQLKVCGPWLSEIANWVDVIATETCSGLQKNSVSSCFKFCIKNQGVFWKSEW